MAHRNLLFMWDFGPDRVRLSHSFLLDRPKSMPMWPCIPFPRLSHWPQISCHFSINPKISNMELFQEASGMLVFEYGQ